MEYAVLRISSDGILVLKWRGEVTTESRASTIREAVNAAIENDDVTHECLLLVGPAEADIVDDRDEFMVVTVTDAKPVGQPKFDVEYGVPGNPTNGPDHPLTHEAPEASRKLVGIFGPYGDRCVGVLGGAFTKVQDARTVLDAWLDGKGAGFKHLRDQYTFDFIAK